MVAPVQNLLAKSMLSHIGFSLTFGTVAAYGYWYKVALANRNTRTEYYLKYNANRAQAL
ncbi:hypothetical protein BCR41DRAFT_398243 [Lobosporangium transversale]|uniref:Uncharacterized protein n=1 Tax=Lobosporangium transversale TaxID=64571 RepID=A0A1Y2GIA3_9FUNG|nr:hypothetical protein BCR41DRAFT_398243 [Lobosporangium transversale]ORZ10593.1 hypothetical protein BCR41DRAFT_398243 [Lobosporangium transversale]|eukprot:XP_021879314.1 hypothetical protein BCR41DRAFT_398243 [Lobosporangium transversale]